MPTPNTENTNDVKTPDLTPFSYNVSEPEKVDDYVKLHKVLTTYKPKTEAEQKEQLKKERKQRLWSAVSDGISAIANAWTVANGGGPIWSPEQSRLKKHDAKIEKRRAEEKQNRKDFYRERLEAMKADEDANFKNWQRYVGNRDFAFKVNEGNDANKKWLYMADYQKSRDSKDDQFRDKEFDEKVRQFAKKYNLDLRKANTDAALAQSTIEKNSPHYIVDYDENGKPIMAYDEKHATWEAQRRGLGGYDTITTTKQINENGDIKDLTESKQVYNPHKKSTPSVPNSPFEFDATKIIYGPNGEIISNPYANYWNSKLVK